MLKNVENLLYRRPELYELVYPEPNDETPTMLRRAFEKHMKYPPRSILDIGCGTGRDLASLSRDGADCVGVDAIPDMVALASSRYPHISFQQGDMRSIRLAKTFDVVMCMGSALMYALTNADLGATLQTFAVHSHPGSLLFLDINNAATCLPGGNFSRELKTEVNTQGFRVSATMTFDFDYRRQLMVRRRTWHFPDGKKLEDFCEYRLLFPAELEAFLDDAGFSVVGMYDNQNLAQSALSGTRLYVAATFRAG
jgi:SAM-dependent methyltransferase